MQLTGVEILNFRSIDHLKVELTPSCRVLVGINESGKSNILRALSLLDTESEPKPEDVREAGPDEDPVTESFVEFEFLLTDEDRAAIVKLACTKILGLDAHKPLFKSGSASLTLTQMIGAVPRALYHIDVTDARRYGRYFKFPDEGELVSVWATVLANTPAGQLIKTLTGADKELKLFSMVEGSRVPPAMKGFLKDATYEDLTRTIGNVISSHVAANVPTTVFWSYDEQHLLPGQINLSGFIDAPNSCLPLKHMFQLAGVVDIKATVEQEQGRPNGMRNLLNRVAKKTTQHLHSVWKEYRNVAIEMSLNGAQIEAFVKDAFNVYNLARRSDGFKRFVTFLLMVSAQVKAGELTDALLLYDEPDTSLHPSGARYLLQELLKIAKRNQVVYSTHSIFMIDSSMPERHLIVKKKNEVTTAEQVNSSNITEEEVIYNALGYSVFAVLKPLNILFEGRRDRLLYERATSRIPAKFSSLKGFVKDVGLCYAKGVKDIGRVTPLLELARRACFILSDGDTVAFEHQKAFDGYGSWHRYDELLPGRDIVTAEDFLMTEYLLEKYEEIRTKQPELPALTLQQFEGVRGKLEVIERHVGRSIRDPESRRRTMDAYKGSLFEDLKTSAITDAYYEMLTELAKAATKEFESITSK